MSKHTPGPWTMETVRTSNGVVFKVGPFPWKLGKLNHACIYADYPGSEGHAICEANAQLTAAAPELLEALKAIEGAEFFPGAWCDRYEKIAEKARAAIEKAERKS